MKKIKVASVVWIVICIFLAVFGLSQSHGGNPSGGIAPGLLLFLLTLPAGLILNSIMLAIIKYFYGAELNISLALGTFLYASMVVIGYFQWFVLLPKLVNRMRQEKSLKVWGLLLIGLIAVLYGLYRFYINAFPGRI